MAFFSQLLHQPYKKKQKVRSGYDNRTYSSSCCSTNSSRNGSSSTPGTWYVRMKYHAPEVYSYTDLKSVFFSSHHLHDMYHRVSVQKHLPWYLVILVRCRKVPLTVVHSSSKEPCLRRKIVRSRRPPWSGTDKRRKLCNIHSQRVRVPVPERSTRRGDEGTGVDAGADGHNLHATRCS